METFSKLRPPDAVRIKAKIVERNDNSSSSALVSSFKYREPKKFCVDPQLTSYDVLYSLIGQAFGLNEEFQMSYLNRENQAVNDNNSKLNEELTKCDFLTISSDWDLDAAFLYSSYPYLSLNILVSSDELFKFDEEQSQKQADQSLNEDWDVISNLDLKTSPQKNASFSSKKRDSLSVETNTNFTNLDTSGRSLIALWSNSAADKAVSVLQRMINPFSKSSSKTGLKRLNSTSSVVDKSKLPNTKSTLAFDLYAMEKLKPPIGDSEYKNFLDSDGRIIILSDLKQRIFDGGCEPSRRKELWPILLDIYPSNQHQPMTAKQRTDYVKLKSAEYVNAKASLWYNLNKNLLRKKSNSLHENELNILANKIQKDVWRTDRCHRFYAGDSNKNVEALFNILMTYSLGNGGFYAQGMSDLLAPLLYVLRDEPLAYICFQALMKRCSSNFDLSSDAICSKIEVLSWLISKYDPVFWQYLRQQGADQLLFVYRWLLIDCKREFPFNDSLRMFEIMWSTIETNSLTNSSNDHSNSSENFFSNFYSRSSSNASSLNLRLFKNYLSRQNALTGRILGDASKTSNSNFVDDEFLSDSEYHSHQSGCLETYSTLSSDKQSKNMISTPEKPPPTTSENFLCEFCLAEKSLLNLKLKKDETTSSSTSDLSTSSDSSLDEDCLEALAKKRNRTKWKQNSRLARCRTNMRPRYLSLNIFNEESCKEVVVSHHTTSKQMNSRKENCLIDIKNKTNLNLKTDESEKKTESKLFPARSLSTSCLECLDLCTSKTNQSRSSRNLLDNNNTAVPTHVKSIKIKKRKVAQVAAIPIIKTSKAFTQHSVSSPAKFSTSETGTLKHSQTNLLNMSSSNHLSSHEVRELISSNSQSDVESPPQQQQQQKESIQFKPKHKKKFKKSSSSKLNENLLTNRSDQKKVNKCTCSSSLDAFSTSTKLKSSSCSNETRRDEAKNLTTTTTSSSGIGASRSASSSDSSKCSTPYPPHATASKQIAATTKTNSFDDDEEEELIYSISKLDNPFLLFVCFALFIEHREHIMSTRMDANDIACYFDKMTRKHNLKSILCRARYLYTKIYLSKTNVFNYLQQLNEIPLNSP